MGLICYALRSVDLDSLCFIKLLLGGSGRARGCGGAAAGEGGERRDQGRRWRTAIHGAAQEGHEAVVRLLTPLTLNSLRSNESGK